jgi:spore germination protein YaaH
MFEGRVPALLAAVAAAAAAGALLSGCGGSAAPPTSAHATRAIPRGAVVWYRTVGSGTELLRQNASRVAVVHPTLFHVQGLHEVSTDPGATQIARAARSGNPRILVVPAVVDDTLSENPSGVEEMRKLLLDSSGGVPGKTMSQHVKDLARLAKPYDGLAIDYEFTIDRLTGDPAPYRAGFTVLIRALREQLGSDKVLAVAVKPRTDAPPTFAQSVYEYRALGQVADQVEVMAYDHAWQTSEPGDIAPAAWVADAAAYAQRALSGTGTRPVLLIANYGYNWPVDASGRRTGPATPESATRLTRLPGFSPTAPTWRYEDGSRSRVVWQVTTGAMANEVAAIAKPRGFDPGFWSVSETDPQGFVKVLAALGSR